MDNVTQVVQFHDIVERKVTEIIIVRVPRLLTQLLEVLKVLSIIEALFRAKVPRQSGNGTLVDLLVSLPVVLHLVVAVGHTRWA